MAVYQLLTFFSSLTALPFLPLFVYILPLFPSSPFLTHRLHQPSLHSLLFFFFPPSCWADGRGTAWFLLLSGFSLWIVYECFFPGEYVTEMKQSHMTLSSGGGVMENFYLLSHTHSVCISVIAGKVPTLPHLYTLSQFKSNPPFNLSNTNRLLSAGVMLSWHPVSHFSLMYITT